MGWRGRSKLGCGYRSPHPTPPHPTPHHTTPSHPTPHHPIPPDCRSNTCIPFSPQTNLIHTIPYPSSAPNLPSGAEFIKCAGANRRSTGILSDIQRKSDNVCTVGWYWECSQCHQKCAPNDAACNAKCEALESCKGPPSKPAEREHDLNVTLVRDENVVEISNLQ